VTDRCRYLVEIDPVRRPGNVVCVEPIQPVPRCKLKFPKHWGSYDMVVRWLWSGGDPMVLGICSRYNCPLDHEHKNSYPNIKKFTLDDPEVPGVVPENRENSSEQEEKSNDLNGRELAQRLKEKQP